MKYTNKLNLPESFITFSKGGDREPSPNKYSVTELLGSTREILLYRKHYKEVEKDICELIPALFGTAVHKVLEENTPDSDKLLKEQSLYAVFGEDTVVGRADLINLDTLSVEDYKTCSVSKITNQDFDDWRKQGLAYAMLYFKMTGTILRHLKFYGLMKDWSKLKAASNANYPQSPLYVYLYDVADSDFDYIEDYIVNKLKELHTTTLPMCSDEEKWYTGTKYAVYKKAGDARAAYVADTEEDAHNYITNKCNGAGEIQVRKGEYLKCLHYCDVCKFCEKEK